MTQTEALRAVDALVPGLRKTGTVRINRGVVAHNLRVIFKRLQWPVSVMLSLESPNKIFLTVTAPMDLSRLGKVVDAFTYKPEVATHPRSVPYAVTGEIVTIHV